MTDVLMLNRAGLQIGDVVTRVVRVRADGSADVRPIGVVTRLVQGDEPLALVRVGRSVQPEREDA